MMNKSSEPVFVSPHDTDYNAVVRPSCVLRYLQEAALMEFYRCGTPLEKMREGGITFLVSRVALTLTRPIRAYEHLTAESWACPSSRMTFLRCGQLLAGEERIASLSTLWALIDLRDRHLLRTDAFSAPFGELAPLTLDLPPRARAPQDAAWEDVFTYVVSYADVDVNRHLNNTHYPDLLCAALPDMDGKFVCGMVLEFHNEAPLGKTILLRRTPAADGWYVQTVGEDGAVGCSCYLRLAPIGEDR